MKINVQFFAVLKDHFGSEMVLENLQTLQDLRNTLIQLHPASKEVIMASKFAIDHQFVPLERMLQSDEWVLVLPPSSGG